VIYTTDDRERERPAAAGSRNRGQFPSEQVARKVLYLAVHNLEEFRSPNTRIRSSGWNQALQASTIDFGG
jgi:putative transposase